MSICRPIAVLLSSAVLLSGCAVQELPPLKATTAPGGQAGAAWITFLPVQQVLSGDAGDFSRAQTELAVLKGRIRRLHRRAEALRVPIIRPVLRTRLQRAAAQQQP